MNDVENQNMYHNEYQRMWEQRSSIKFIPRRVIDFDKKGYFFPEEKQPLLDDYRIKRLGEDVKVEILLLSFYKHLMDITDLEIKLINATCNKILFDELDVKYDVLTKLDILSVITDEYYHVYMASDIIIQLKKHYPNISKYAVPLSDAYLALTETLEEMDKQYRDMFQVIAICIYEATLVKELGALFESNKIHESVKLYVKAHINDEARHCSFFTKLLSSSWNGMNDEYQNVIGANLIAFLIRYFSISSWRNYNKEILKRLAIDEITSEEMISELYDNFEVTSDIPMVKNLLKVFDKVGITKNKEFNREMLTRQWQL